jgi:2-polyprenyl-3-methyl-5-hydroxy-6-metoxy-1,4-benzoquinol methylase
MNKKLYEKFHQTTKLHKSIITINDYTYGHIIKMIRGYVSQQMKVLDLGCGTGALDFYLASNGSSVYGIDISDRAITSCKENAQAFDLNKKCQFKATTLEDFKTKDKFDLVLCIEVIEHIEKDSAAIKKISTLLKPGGILILSTPSLNAPLYKIGFLNEFDKRVGHLRRYSNQSLQKLISTNGFRVKKIIKNEGVVRNFVFNSKIGGKIIIRLINRSSLLKKFFEILDRISLPIFGESDLLVIGIKKCRSSSSLRFIIPI